MNTVALPKVLASCLVFAAFAGVSHQALAGETADKACRVHVLAAPSDFPLEAQKQAEHGVVKLTVSIDATGQAQAVTTLRSSGYPRLDAAASASVLKEWRFDVSECSNGGFPVVKQIEVAYRQAPLTVYGTRSAHWAKLLASARANPACATRFDSTAQSGDFSVACVEPRELARESLAQAAAGTRQ